MADTIVKLSALAIDLKDHLAELDVNPLFVMEKGRGVVAADALIKPNKKPESALQALRTDDAKHAA